MDSIFNWGFYSKTSCFFIDGSWNRGLLTTKLLACQNQANGCSRRHRQHKQCCSVGKLTISLFANQGCCFWWFSAFLSVRSSSCPRGCQNVAVPQIVTGFCVVGAISCRLFHVGQSQELVAMSLSISRVVHVWVWVLHSVRILQFVRIYTKFVTLNNLMAVIQTVNLVPVLL